jgi:hypothetical protein
MVKQRSIDKFPNPAAKHQEFPTFSGWVRLILLNIVTLMLLALVVYPLMSQIAVWIQPALDEELNDFARRHIRRWNRARDPRILRSNFCMGVCLIIAYPVFAMLDRLFRWASSLRHRPGNTKIKKNRIT